MLPIPCISCFLDPEVEACQLGDEARDIGLDTTITDEQKQEKYAALIPQALKRHCSRIEDIKAYLRGKEG